MNEKIFTINGLNGKKSLKGRISINGAKNAALKAIASTVLFDGPVRLQRVPWTEDTKILVEIIKGLGAKVDILEKSDGDKTPGVTMVIDPKDLNSSNPKKELSEKMRASVTLTGPLLGRFGEVSFPVPGGCVIGERPIDLFIKGYQKMSAYTEVKDCVYEIKTKDKLCGAEIFFDVQTVGGTETLMMAGILAHGTTILKNCALEPEIVSLGEFLNENGADIKGLGTTTITIQGRGGKLLSPKSPYVTIPDRIEAGSFVILGALLGEDLMIDSVNPKDLDYLFSFFEKVGISNYKIEKDSVHFNNKHSSYVLSDIDKSVPIRIRTHEYPGFPTDLQAPITAMSALLDGFIIKIFETIYEGRFKYVENLKKMGANIAFDNPREITVVGAKQLKASDEVIDAYDIRAGFAEIIAGAYAQGVTKIKNIRFIDRGYEEIENRLKSIGVDIQRVDMI